MNVENYKRIMQHLKKYKGILSNVTFSYLEALVNLEISALSNDINDRDRVLLSELKIYRELVIYNIYHRTYNLLQENKEFGNLKIDGGIVIPSQELRVVSNIDDKQIDIFNFNSLRFPSEDFEINLYLTCENQALREKEMQNLLNAYNNEENKSNPYSNRKGSIGGSFSDWQNRHSIALSEINRKYNNLNNRTSITDFEKRVIEIQQYYYDLLLENMGIDKETFQDLKYKYINIGIDTQKVKRYPHLNVYSNTRNL